jgi:ketosteroid isomerase-like protein
MIRFSSEQLEVRDLLERSCDAINHQDWAALAAMMEDDVVWERKPPTPWTLAGRDAVGAFLAGRLSNLTILHHEISGSAIDIADPTRATCRSIITELVRVRDTRAVVRVVGTCNDEFGKSAGGWRLVRRTITPRFEQDVKERVRTSGSRLADPSQRPRLSYLRW